MRSSTDPKPEANNQGTEIPFKKLMKVSATSNLVKLFSELVFIPGGALWSRAAATHTSMMQVIRECPTYGFKSLYRGALPGISHKLLTGGISKFLTPVTSHYLLHHPYTQNLQHPFWSFAMNGAASIPAALLEVGVFYPLSTLETIRQQVKQTPIKASHLYRGYETVLAKNMVGHAIMSSATHFNTPHPSAKPRTDKEQITHSTLVAMFSILGAQIFKMPFDRTRKFAQGQDLDSWTAFWTIIAKEGYGGLWKAWPWKAAMALGKQAPAYTAFLYLLAQVDKQPQQQTQATVTEIKDKETPEKEQPKIEVTDLETEERNTPTCTR